MTGIQIYEAIETLKTGKIPPGLDEITADAKKTLFEMRNLMDALQECVQRQGNTISVLRSINAALEKQVNALKGRGT